MDAVYTTSGKDEQMKKTASYYHTKARNKAINKNLARRAESLSDGQNDFERRAIREAAEQRQAVEKKEVKER
jgi:hypothetical protein